LPPGRPASPPAPCAHRLRRAPRPAPPPPCAHQDFFFGLHDRGFVIFSKEANYENGAGGVEYAFVKLAPAFFLNDTQYYKTKGLPGERSAA
jgi:hypothetical protein